MMRKVTLFLIAGAFLLAPFAGMADAGKFRRRCKARRCCVKRVRHCCKSQIPPACGPAQDVSTPIVDFEPKGDTGELWPIITDEVRSVMEDPDNRPIVKEVITDEIRAKLKDPKNLPHIEGLEGVTTKKADDGATVTIVEETVEEEAVLRLGAAGQLPEMEKELVGKLIEQGKLRTAEEDAPPAPAPAAPAVEPAPPAPPAPAPAPAPAV
ncbi:hypothetical protein ACFL5Q_06250 [Planctomycetota bacterium]